ncbi:MAG: response regulator [Candidatus Latescibacteria bacterium]|nr:response regulator [Candidatus Latescibacterota bacterium]
MASTKEQPRGKILVVDDEEPVGRLLELWLAEEGYTVRRASSFEQACDWMGKESFDLVTLDIMMPVVDGLQSLRWFREYHPEVGVVMATALGEMDLVIEAMRLGAYSYMVKPFKLELVAHELARALERQRLVAENLSYQRELEQKVEEQTRQLRAAYVHLERQVKELEGRDQLVRCQSEGPTPQQACQVIMEVLYQVLGGEAAVLYESEGEGKGLVPIATLDEAGQVGTEGLAEDSREWVKKNALAVQVYSNRQGHHQPGQGTALPLLYQEEVLGVLWVRGLDGEAQQEERNLLWRLGQAAALVLWAARVKEQLDSGQLQVDELLKMQ